MPTATPTEIAYVVTPVVECVDIQNDGTILAHFGYQSDAQEVLTIPIGETNRFLSGQEDQGQPDTFDRGRIVDAFTISFPTNAEMTWLLGHASVTADIRTQRCQGAPNCVETNISGVLAGLDVNSIKQEATLITLVKRALALGAQGPEREELEALRSRAHDLYLQQWTEIWGRFSKVNNTCSGCTEVGKIVYINDIVSRSNQLRRLSKRALAIIKGLRPGVLPVEQELYEKARSLHQKTVGLTSRLPRFESLCD